MGKFKDDAQKQRIQAFFKGIHKTLNTPDEEVEKQFKKLPPEHVMAKELLEKVDKQYSKMCKKYPLPEGYYIFNDSERISRALLKDDETNDPKTNAENKAFNEKLLELVKTKDGYKTIIKMAAEEIYKADLGLVKGNPSQVLKNWQENPHLFNIMFIVQNIRDNYKSLLSGTEEYDSKIVEYFNENLVQIERASNAQSLVRYMADDVYPYVPKKGFELVNLMALISANNIDGVTLTNDDKISLNMFVGDSIGAVEEGGIYEEYMKERSGIEKVKSFVNLDFADFRKQFESDSEMKEFLTKDIAQSAYLSEVMDERNAQFAKLAGDVLADFDKAAKAPKEPGKELYKKLKTAYFKAGNTIDAKNVNAEYHKAGSKDLYDVESSKFVDEMINLLNDGDKWYRGSSSAYKDIQKKLNDLKKIIDCKKDSDFFKNEAEYKRLIEVGVKSVRDMAANYVNNRPNNAINCSAESYKGKRVINMAKVFNRLEAKVNSWNEKALYTPEDHSSPVPASYASDMEKMLKDGNFSGRLLAETIAAKSFAEDDYKAGEVTFGNLKEKADKIATSLEMKTLSSYYGETSVNYNDAVQKFKKICKIMADYKKNMEKYNTLAMLNGEKDRLKEVRKNFTPKKIEKYKLDINAIDYKGKITGDIDLDAVIVEAKRSYTEHRINNLLNDKKLEKTVQIEIKNAAPAK